MDENIENNKNKNSDLDPRRRDEAPEAPGFGDRDQMGNAGNNKNSIPGKPDADVDVEDLPGGDLDEDEDNEFDDDDEEIGTEHERVTRPTQRPVEEG